MSNKAIMNNYCVILIKPNGRVIVRNLISIIASSETIHELISESTGYPEDNVIVLGYSLQSAGEPVLLGDLFRIVAEEN